MILTSSVNLPRWTLTDRSVELLGADAAGLMLADQRGNLRLIASSAESARLLEVFELQNSEGPCLDCFHTGEQLVNLDDATMQARWPNFWARDQAAGVPVSARPADAPARRGDRRHQPVRHHWRVAERRRGGGGSGDGRRRHDRAAAGTRGDAERDVLVEQLQTALNSRVLIEQAKGVLSERARIPIDEAFTSMRAHARQKGTTLTTRSRPAILNGSLQTVGL